MKGYTGFTKLYAKEDIVAPKISKLVKIGTIKFNSAASGTAVKLGTVPAGAIITRAVCVIKTAFNAVSTNVLTVGTSDTADALLAAADITEGTPAAYSKFAFLLTGSSDLSIYATYSQSGTAASTGEADVWVEYSLT